MIRIQSIYGKTLFEGDFPDLKAALEKAVVSGANLSGADLRGADLRGANLSVADLSGANLSGANLRGANLSVANLRGANLSVADLSGANLSGADLRGANLSVADLSGANLSGADLSVADLSGANLSGADLRGATGYNPNAVDSLRILRDQPGKIRAYKLVTADGHSPMCNTQGGTPIHYEIGKTYTVEADTNEGEHCSRGINLCDLPWAIRNYSDGMRIFVAEFTARDIAAIPHGNDGKFRVSRCKIVGEKDLVEIGVAAGPVKSRRKPARKRRGHG